MRAVTAALLLQLLSDIECSRVDHAAWEQPSRNHSCRSCSWLHNSSQLSARHAVVNGSMPLSAGLVFVHLRKAGGTSVLHLLRQWLKRHGCDNEDDYGRVWGWTKTFGVYEGVYRRAESQRRTPQTKICPTVDVRHAEYACIHGRLALHLPQRLERRFVPFSLFTVIRNPIDRLISQAFYTGEKSAHKYIVNRMHAECGAGHEMACGDPRNKQICDCMRRAQELALANLKTNETFWFTWYHHKQGFRDRAMTNYYIKRLAGDYDTEQFESLQNGISELQPALHCLMHPEEDCRHAVELIDVLGCTTACAKSLNNTSEALEIAKRVLTEQFDFILFEKINDDFAVHVLSRVLQEPSPAFVREALKVEKNVGLYNITRTDKSHLLPAAFLEYIKRDNAADLQLYDYACAVYTERAASEEWVYYRSLS